MAKVGGKYRFLNGNRLENGGWVMKPVAWTVTIIGQKRSQFELEYDFSETPEGISHEYHGMRCWYNVGWVRSGLERGDIIEESA